MGQPGKLIRACLGGLELVAVYAIGPRSGRPVKIGASPNVTRRLADLQIAHWEEIVVHRIFWCTAAKYAERVHAACRAALTDAGAHMRGDWFDLTSEEAAAAIEAAARSCNVSLEADESIRAAAERIVSTVEAQVEELQRTGGMKEINRAYREYRLKTEAAGGKAIRYGAWIDDYKKKLASTVGEHIRVAGESIVQTSVTASVTSAGNAPVFSATKNKNCRARSRV
jgi:hypothetical protein